MYGLSFAGLVINKGHRKSFALHSISCISGEAMQIAKFSDVTKEPKQIKDLPIENQYPPFVALELCFFCLSLHFLIDRLKQKRL